MGRVHSLTPNPKARPRSAGPELKRREITRPLVGARPSVAPSVVFATARRTRQPVLVFLLRQIAKDIGLTVEESLGRR